MKSRLLFGALQSLVAVHTSSAAPIAAGDLLELNACRDASFAAQQLVVRASDSTVRTPDGALCVTLAGPSPAQLAMQPCGGAAAAAQQWAYSAGKGGVFEQAGAPGGCVAWNTQGGLLSSWPCSSEAWTGFFSIGAPAAGMISANASAQQPAGMCVTAVGAPGGPCSDDTDCTLTGTCNAATGVCSCFAPWTGADCGQLRFKALAAPARSNGYGQWPLSSWGGNAIFYDGLYHLIVAEMVNNCTLEYWGSNSQCTHATSASPEGPYIKSDIAVGVWCHNPSLSYIPEENLWALWHIGSGTGGNPPNCNSSASAAAGPVSSPAASGSPLHLAKSPYGPWTPFTDWGLPDCNNPTQMQHPNGTWFIICDSTRMYRGPNVTGPFNYVLDVPTGPVHGTYEDGLLWMDVRGIWHVFFHVYTMTCDTPECDPTAISGHSFSRDGLEWFRSPTQPYFTTANVTDGSVVQMSTRERPKLIFGANGEPTHLINGVDENPHCPPQAAIQCKVHGDHTQTLVVPLDFS